MKIGPLNITLRRDRTRKYEAAQTTRHSEKAWTNATAGDADSFISSDLATLRQRARYEIRNNSYAKGIVDTLANDIVGTGPQIQVDTPAAGFNEAVEAEFREWSSKPDLLGRLSLAEMLRLVIYQFCESGEALIVRENTPERPNADQVRLKLLMIEPDRLASPLNFIGDPLVREGVKVDEIGRPVGYYINQRHPGDSHTYYAADQYDLIDSSKIDHLFRQDRPGQSRGVPWLAPCLELFSSLRRYTEAVIAAAETAADISGVIQSNSPDLDPQDIDDLDSVEVEKRMLLTLPAGWNAEQFKPEQPSSSYKEFKAEILNEIARCINTPYNVAAANSSGYNYASGRLDWQVYFRFVRVIEGYLATNYLTPLFLHWLTEARRVRGLIPLATITRDLKVTWFWPGAEHVDPQKEANAQKIRLETHTTSLASEYARQGKDWETELTQIAREKELMTELGLTGSVIPETTPETNESESESDEEEKEETDQAVA